MAVSVLDLNIICKNYSITEEEIMSLLSFLKVVYTIGNISPASSMVD